MEEANKKIKTSAEILNEIIDTMTLWDGEDIAEKAGEILGHPVTYKGDDLFEINEEAL